MVRTRVLTHRLSVITLALGISDQPYTMKLRDIWQSNPRKRWGTCGAPTSELAKLYNRRKTRHSVVTIQRGARFTRLARIGVCVCVCVCVCAPVSAYLSEPKSEYTPTRRDRLTCGDRKSGPHKSVTGGIFPDL